MLTKQTCVAPLWSLYCPNDTLTQRECLVQNCAHWLCSRVLFVEPQIPGMHNLG